MKPLNVSPVRIRMLLVLAAITSASSTTASATTLTWDPTLAPTSPVGGAGTWNTSTANWSNGSTDITWNNSNADIASFGGTAGTVTLASDLSAGGLVFNSSGYTLNLNTNTKVLTIGAEGIDLSALSSGTTTITAGSPYNSASTVALGADQTWKLGTGSNLSVNSVTNAGNKLTLNATGSLTAGIFLTGTGGLGKTGAGNVTLSNAFSGYTGNVTIDGGTLTVGTVATSLNGSASTLGAVNSASKTITINTGGTLAMTTNNIMGNASNATKATIAVNGGTLTTTHYNAIGSLQLNGGTVTSSAAGSDAYQGFALRGSVTVGGTSASTLQATSSGATSYGYHLGANTSFNVADATGSSATDLTVSAALRNHSGDYASNGAAGFTKSGAGTMELTGANTYTGATTVSAGTLKVSGSGTINSSSGVTVSGGVFDYGNNTTGLTRNVTVSGGTFKNNSTQNYTGTLTFTSGTIGGTNFAGKTFTIGTGQTIAPGNSPGTLVTDAQTWQGGGTYAFEINNVTGTAGTEWDLIASTGGLTIAATSGSQFNLTLLGLTAGGASGLVTGFDSAASYSWKIASFTSISGTLFDANLFNVDTSGFTNDFAGTFTVTKTGNDIFLSYAGVAIPEPSTYATLLGACVFALVNYRRRR